MDTKVEKCRCPHHMMTGIFFMLIGLTFLLGNLEVISAQVVGIAWPSILTLAEITKLVSGKCSCCSHS